jgi:hypothetical protein
LLLLSFQGKQLLLSSLDLRVKVLGGDFILREIKGFLRVAGAVCHAKRKTLSPFS